MSLYALVVLKELEWKISVGYEDSYGYLRNLRTNQLRSTKEPLVVCFQELLVFSFVFSHLMFLISIFSLDLKKKLYDGLVQDSSSAQLDH